MTSSAFDDGKKPRARKQSSTRKTERLETRLTEKEKRAVEAMAANAGMSASAYVRAAALGNGYDPPQVDAKQLNELLHQVKKLGTNMNQIAYRLNRSDIVSSDEIIAALNRHKEAARGLEQLIDDARGPR